jgi:hypothetical protein
MIALETGRSLPGLTEIHVEVQWADGGSDLLGHRFFHVRHDGAPPCVSEAIEAVILYGISAGKQSMTGHVTLPEECDVILEVWTNVDTTVRDWRLEVIPAIVSP